MPKWPKAYPSFCCMKRLGIFLLSPGWDTKSIAGLPPVLNLPVPIHTPGWREALRELGISPKNTSQCPQTGLKPGLLNPESGVLTMRPPRHPIKKVIIIMLFNQGAHTSKYRQLKVLKVKKNTILKFSRINFVGRA